MCAEAVPISRIEKMHIVNNDRHQIKAQVIWGAVSAWFAMGFIGIVFYGNVFELGVVGVYGVINKWVLVAVECGMSIFLCVPTRPAIPMALR